MTIHKKTLSISILVAGLATLLWASFAIGQATTARRYIPGVRPDLPFSQAVQIGDTLYLSGDGVLDPATNTPYADPAQEAEEMMKSFERTLAKAGMTMDDLVYVTIYCSDLSLYDTFNKIYRTHFKKEFPARAFIGAGDLLFGMRFEIQGIAIKR
jgi:enamine deaminase RidA (YjgF/YER057c/UK114 family)